MDVKTAKTWNRIFCNPINRMGKEVKATIKRLQGIYPIGIEFVFVAFQPYHLEKKVNDFVRNLIEVIVIVILIMLIFLKREKEKGDGLSLLV